MTKAPLFLRILIIFTTIVYGMLGLFFLIALFYEKSIREIISHYEDAGNFPVPSFIIFLSGFMLHGIAIWGLIRIWRLHIKGFYLFIIPTILLALYQLIRPEFSMILLFFYLGTAILFAFFIRKMH